MASTNKIVPLIAAPVLANPSSSEKLHTCEEVSVSHLSDAGDCTIAISKPASDFPQAIEQSYLSQEVPQSVERIPVILVRRGIGNAAGKFLGKF